jgi:hypothetical protein
LEVGIANGLKKQSVVNKSHMIKHNKQLFLHTTTERSTNPSYPNPGYTTPAILTDGLSYSSLPFPSFPSHSGIPKFEKVIIHSSVHMLVSADLEGSPVGHVACDQMRFSPVVDGDRQVDEMVRYVQVTHHSGLECLRT